MTVQNRLTRFGLPPIAAALILTLTAHAPAQQSTTKRPASATATSQPKPARPQLRAPKFAPKALPTGAGTRLVGPVDFHVPGGQAITPPNGNPVRIVKNADRSFLHVYGTVHSGGMTYFSAAPVFRELQNIVSNRPRECPVYWSGGTQEKDKNFYAVTIRFDNTASNGVCWQYFRNLKSLDVSAHIVEFKKHSKDYGPDRIQATDGENRVATVGPIIPATQSAAN